RPGGAPRARRLPPRRATGAPHGRPRAADRPLPPPRAGRCLAPLPRGGRMTPGRRATESTPGRPGSGRRPGVLRARYRGVEAIETPVTAAPHVPPVGLTRRPFGSISHPFAPRTLTSLPRPSP